MTGLASQISEIFRRNAGTVTSPWAQIWPLITGLCPPASNLSFRGPPLGTPGLVLQVPNTVSGRLQFELCKTNYWLWRKTANTKKFAILSAFEWPEK